MKIDWVDNIGTITGITDCGKYVFLDSEGTWRVVGTATIDDRANMKILISQLKKTSGVWRSGEPMPVLENA